MTNYLDTLSVLILISAFILMGNKKIKSYIKTFQLQSILIAVLTGIMGISRIQNEGAGQSELLIVCGVIIAIKVVVIPKLLNQTCQRVSYKVEKDFFFNIPLLIIGCCLIVVFTYFSVATTAGINAGPVNAQVINSISLILIGLFFMISRKKAIGQIVGFLVIENGIFITALFATQGMPFIVDMGILMDVLVGVIIMGMMVFRIDEKFGSIDTNKIKDLRG